MSILNVRYFEIKTQAKHAVVKRKLIKSTQLEAIPEAQRGEFDALVKDRREQLKKLGFENALKESERDELLAFSSKSIVDQNDLDSFNSQPANKTQQSAYSALVNSK